MERTLYLDCEFNGHGGELISMALVPDTGNIVFYGEWPLPTRIHPWVEENVIPKLHRVGMSISSPRARLVSFLHAQSAMYDHLTIVADWPADFQYLLGEMVGSTYEQSCMIPCTMRLIQSGNIEIPANERHNALVDAQYLRNWCVENNIT